MAALFSFKTEGSRPPGAFHAFRFHEQEHHAHWVQSVSSSEEDGDLHMTRSFGQFHQSPPALEGHFVWPGDSSSVSASAEGSVTIHQDTQPVAKGVGQPSSVGSIAHVIPEGKCKPCIFISAPCGCDKGTECPYCHLTHKFRMCKGKRDRTRRLLEKRGLAGQAAQKT
eukprot:g11912.t1